VVGPPLSLSDEGAKLAQARAEETLSKMGRNVVIPLPCPNCGCYQPDMVERLRTEGTSNAPVAAGLIVIVLSLIPLAFSIPYLWIATVAGISVGFGLIGYADWSAARWDPNAGDPEKRKARGRKSAVWGEELDRLLATDLDAGPAPAARAVGGQAADDQFRFKLWASDGPAAHLRGRPAFLPAARRGTIAGIDAATGRCPMCGSAIDPAALKCSACGEVARLRGISSPPDWLFIAAVMAGGLVLLVLLVCAGFVVWFLLNGAISVPSELRF
jgi:hypothetical protein